MGHPRDVGIAGFSHTSTSSSFFSMATLDEHYPSGEILKPMDPFKSHLVALLSVYELGPFPPIPVPRYDGPTDWQTDTILNSLSRFARKMWTAEDLLNKYKLGQDMTVSAHFLIDHHRPTEISFVAAEWRQDRGARRERGR